MKKVKKQPFTLLELLIVLTLLSLGAVLVGLKLKESYQEQRFLSEVDQLTSHLQMAQDLMLIMDTDVHFYLIKDQESVYYSLKVAKPLVVKKMQGDDQSPVLDRNLSVKWSQLVERQIPLNGIRSFAFTSYDQKEMISPQLVQSDQTALQTVVIQFSLMKMSKGELVLASTKHLDESKEELNERKKIFLVGYPCAIQCQKEMPQENNLLEESRSLYPQY